MKRIVLLGATGSIGRNVLDVVARHPERFVVVGMAAHTSAGALGEAARLHPGAMLALTDPDASAQLRAVGFGDRMLDGNRAMERLIGETAPDLVVNAVVGFAGLSPTMAAVDAGISVAIANKETVVTGGEILVEAARRSGASLVPIDSEHAAIAQCLRGQRVEDVDRVFITASGGALRNEDPATFADVTREQVLAHPTWNMGEKITVDSATLVNKGLEVIEAHWLFGLPYDAIDVVVHPQSIIHAMVRFIDGSIVAQMGEPDMRLPILFALSWPDRVSSTLRHDVRAFPDLTFGAVDARRYPCFDHVMRAARTGGAAVTVISAANELAVAAFLNGHIEFSRISDTIAAALDAVEAPALKTLSDILDTDARTRAWVLDYLAEPGLGTG